MNVIQCFHPFASNLKWLVTKNTRRNDFTIISLCSFYKGITTKRWKLRLSPRRACFRTKAHPWETFRLLLMLMKWFPLQHQSSCTYLKIHANNTMRFAIFMIYKHIYNHPFKKFMNRKYEGVEDLMCGNVGETNWFKRFLIRAWVWWGVNEIAFMLIDVIFPFKL